MTIVQISWCDSERDVRRNYPNAFDGIPERFSAPMAEYVLLDSIELARELRTRITKHVPIERQPYIQVLLSGPGAVKDHWSRYSAAPYNSPALVFSSGRGTVLDRHTLLSRQLKPAAKALGFGNVNWHCCVLERHIARFDRNSSRHRTGAVGSLLKRDHPTGIPAFADRRSTIGCEKTGNASNWTQIGPKFGDRAVAASRMW